MIIYETKNKVNGMVYRGQHICHQKCQAKCSYLGSGIRLKRAIKKYGKENFRRRTLASTTCQYALDHFEAFYITEQYVERNDTYNLQSGGGSHGKLSASSRSLQRDAWKRRKERGWKHTAEAIEKTRQSHLGKEISLETRAKISAALSGHEVTPETKKKIGKANKGNRHPNSIKNIAHYWKGKLRSKESVEKSAKSRCGKKRTPEQRERISIATKAAMTPERIEKSRQANLGRKLLKEHKEKLRLANTGRVVSTETRKKISETLKGHAVSKETKNKISIAHKAIRVAKIDTRQTNIFK